MSSAHRWMLGSNGPSSRKSSVRAARRRRRPSRPSAAAWRGTARARRGATGSSAGMNAPERAGERMRAALDGSRRDRPAGARATRRGGRAGRACRARCRPVSVSGLSRTVTSSVTCSSARLQAAPKPGLSRRSITVAPCFVASAAPPSSGPLSTTTSWARGSAPSSRESSAREPCSTITIAKLRWAILRRDRFDQRREPARGLGAVEVRGTRSGAGGAGRRPAPRAVPRRRSRRRPAGTGGRTRA